MSDLKPCPFCGGEARLVSGPPGCHYVMCEECYATSDDRGAERSIAAWNRRTPADLAAAVERAASAGEDGHG